MSPNGGRVDAGFRNVARGDVELALPFELHAHGFAPDGHIDQVLHVFDIDGVARQGLAIDVDAKLRLVRLLFDAGVGRSPNPAQEAQALKRVSPEGFQVRAADNHGQIGRRTRNGLGHHVDDGLREVEIGARDVVAKPPGKLLHQVFLDFSARPLGIGPQGHQQFDAIGAERVRALFHAAALRAHHKHFGGLVDETAHVGSDFGGLGERRAGRQVGPDPDDALVQLRQEFAAQIGPHGEHSGRDGEGGQCKEPGVIDDAPDVPAVAVDHPSQHRIPPDLRPVLEKIGGQHGNHRGGEQQRAQQRGAHRKCHGSEQPPLHPLQREQGQIGADQDRQREQNGPLDLNRRPTDGVEGAGSPDLARGELAHDVFHHDQRAVHDDAEIERPQAQQAGMNSVNVHAQKGEQQGERDHDGGEHRGAHAAQEEEQHQEDDRQAFEQRVRDRIAGCY